jgi:hypothetical protein
MEQQMRSISAKLLTTAGERESANAPTNPSLPIPLDPSLTIMISSLSLTSCGLTSA